MSTSLVKKSLALFEDDLIEEPVKTKKKKVKNPMSAISTKKVGVKRELRKLRKQEQQKSRRKTVQSSIYNDNYTGSGCTDISEDIVNRIVQLDSVNRLTSSKNKKYQGKQNKQPVGKTKDSDLKQEKSMFSDKDFEDFSQEFDFNKSKKS